MLTPSCHVFKMIILLLYNELYAKIAQNIVIISFQDEKFAALLTFLDQNGSRIGISFIGLPTITGLQNNLHIPSIRMKVTT